jgi:predicted nucleic acid-binding protein
MILVDSNVLMYAAGAANPHKGASVAFLRRIAEGEVEATIDAEVLQEILHRYRSIGRWEEGSRVYDLTRVLFPAVVPVTGEVVDRARGIMEGGDGILARDALHAAVTLTHRFDAICSYDRDFDTIPGIVRREPEEI